MDYNKIRRNTKEIKIGNTAIGKENKIAIQSMTNTDTKDKVATIEQIKQLENAGCDIVRVTVADIESVDTIIAIKESGIIIPIVADIHFDYKIALKCAEIGVDKIRINPGNIGDDARVAQVCSACRNNNIPIRIGVNSGSVEKNILAKYGAPTPQAMCESALYHVSLLEKNDFYDTVISIKASDVKTTIDANRILASKCDYPIHVGITESGSESMGSLKSAAGIGAMLCDGIGDTIRVSLTNDPVREVVLAKKLFTVLDIDTQKGMNIISCPTCGRTKINLIKLVADFERAVEKENLNNLPITVALMGCVVNGPGEAREADIGIAGGRGEAVLFTRGKIIAKISESDIIDTLIKGIKALIH